LGTEDIPNQVGTGSSLKKGKAFLPGILILHLLKAKWIQFQHLEIEDEMVINLKPCNKHKSKTPNSFEVLGCVRD
tara:strand:+ start:9807 stop:10031 length:225 start_codon:yes stop_codon:yes gene_type:complete